MIIRARTTAALGAKKARGKRVGGIPFGFQLGADGRTLVQQLDEQRTLGVLRMLRATVYMEDRERTLDTPTDKS